MRCIPGEQVKKIIFINRYFYPDLSATSQMVSDLAFHLAERGARVWVVTSRQRYENPMDRLPSRELHARVEICRVWTTRFGRMNLIGRMFDYASFYISSLIRLLRITKPGDVIVAKTDPPLISIIAWIAARAKRAKLINWLQDVFPEVAAALGVLTWKPAIGLIRFLRNISLRGAAMNIVLGERMRAHICAQGVTPENATVICNWADAELIKPIPPNANPLRGKWKLEGKFVVGYSGNMGRAHEFETIIGAMRKVQDDADIVFLFVGGGAAREALEHAVHKHDLHNSLFMPYQPRELLSESLSVPDVHLVSLRPNLEGLIVPSKIYGIVAAGRPAIFVGDSDGEVARMMRRCKSGFVVPVGGDAELEQRLRELKANPDIAAAMGNRGRRCFLEAYDKSYAANVWETVLTLQGYCFPDHDVPIGPERCT